MFSRHLLWSDIKQISSIDGRVLSQHSFSVKSDAGDVNKVMLGNIPGHWDWTTAQLLCPTYIVKWLIKMIPGTYLAGAVSKAVPGGIRVCTDQGHSPQGDRMSSSCSGEWKRIVICVRATQCQLVSIPEDNIGHV